MIVATTRTACQLQSDVSQGRTTAQGQLKHTDKQAFVSVPFSVGFENKTSVVMLQVGDGTTTVVILAGEFLRECKPFIEEGVHPQSLIRSFRQAGQLAVQRLKDLAISIEGPTDEQKKDMLRKCASTSLNSKLVSSCGCCTALVLPKGSATGELGLDIRDAGELTLSSCAAS